jgi:hypothetical protein
MKDSISFYAFDLLREVPAQCSVCVCTRPVLRYKAVSSAPDGEPQETRGYCCAECATRLLRKLETTEAREWKEEKKILEAEGVEVSDFAVR